MDGARAVDEIWHSLLNSLGEKSPTQDDTIEILCQLSDNGLLQCEITPDVAELFRRSLERGKKRRMSHAQSAVLPRAAVRPRPACSTGWRRWRAFLFQPACRRWLWAS